MSYREARRITVKYVLYASKKGRSAYKFGGKIFVIEDWKLAQTDKASMCSVNKTILMQQKRVYFDGFGMLIGKKN